jgi:hypothetical protein
MYTHWKSLYIDSTKPQVLTIRTSDGYVVDYLLPILTKASPVISMLLSSDAVFKDKESFILDVKWDHLEYILDFYNDPLYTHRLPPVSDCIATLEVAHKYEFKQYFSFLWQKAFEMAKKDGSMLVSLLNFAASRDITRVHSFDTSMLSKDIKHLQPIALKYITTHHWYLIDYVLTFEPNLITNEWLSHLQPPVDESTTYTRNYYSVITRLPPCEMKNSLHHKMLQLYFDKNTMHDNYTTKRICCWGE